MVFESNIKFTLFYRINYNKTHIIISFNYLNLKN